jgi:hypothetical protein
LKPACVVWSSLIDAAPLKSTSCIAQSSAPSVSPMVSVPRSPEMKIATPASFVPTPCVLVEVDRGAEGGAVVGRAGHREGDVDVLNELGGVRVAVPEPPWTPICAEPLSAISADATPAVATRAVVAKRTFFMVFPSCSL